METKGVVEVVKPGDGKYGFRIGSVWYNGFGDLPCKKGDAVTVVYEQNGLFKNVKSCTITTIGASVENSAELNGRLRRITDCILAADEDFRMGKIAKEEIANHARALHNLIDELSK